MNKELTAKLINEYPNLFGDIYGNPSETAMCFGIECEDGWFDIIDCFCLAVTEYIKEQTRKYKNDFVYNECLQEAIYGNHEPFNDVFGYLDIHLAIKNGLKELNQPLKTRFTQIKEKFGSLRLYMSSYDDYISALERQAELMSYRICEVCGKPGKPNNNGWIKTVCEEHKK